MTKLVIKPDDACSTIDFDDLGPPRFYRYNPSGDGSTIYGGTILFHDKDTDQFGTVDLQFKCATQDTISLTVYAANGSWPGCADSRAYQFDLDIPLTGDCELANLYGEHTWAAVSNTIGFDSATLDLTCVIYPGDQFKVATDCCAGTPRRMYMTAGMTIGIYTYTFTGELWYDPVAGYWNIVNGGYNSTDAGDPSGLIAGTLVCDAGTWKMTIDGFFTDEVPDNVSDCDWCADCLVLNKVIADPGYSIKACF